MQSIQSSVRAKESSISRISDTTVSLALSSTVTNAPQANGYMSLLILRKESVQFADAKPALARSERMRRRDSDESRKQKKKKNKYDDEESNF